MLATAVKKRGGVLPMRGRATRWCELHASRTRTPPKLLRNDDHDERLTECVKKSGNGFLCPARGHHHDDPANLFQGAQTSTSRHLAAAASAPALRLRQSDPTAALVHAAACAPAPASVSVRISVTSVHTTHNNMHYSSQRRQRRDRPCIRPRLENQERGSLHLPTTTLTMRPGT